MRKLAGTITPCQSNAAAMRLMRSPPAAKKVATTSTATSARSAKGSRSASRGAGAPALRVLAARSARSTWARHSASDIGVLGRGRDLVGDRGRRPMRQAGIAIEPPQAVDPARHPQHEERREGRGREQEEDAEPDGAADRRQPQPKPEPRERQKQADHGRDRGQRRPQPFPEDRPARPAQRPRQQVAAGALLRGGLAAGWRRPRTDRSSHVSSKRESAGIDINTHYRPVPAGKRKAPTDQNDATGIWFRRLGAHSQGGRRSSAIRSETSRRGRTSAHSPSRTSTSGTNGAGIVGAGLDRAIGAGGHDRQQVARRAATAMSRSSARKSPDSQTGPTTSATMRARPARGSRTGRISW